MQKDLCFSAWIVMAYILAVQNGNWSSSSTWQGGVPPGPGDIAVANGKTVTIDVDATCDEITTAAVGGGVGGGIFYLDNGKTLTANVKAGTSRCLQFNVAGGEAWINGNVTGGSGSDAVGVWNNSSGTVNITGNVTGGSGSSAYGIYNSSSGTVNITGNVYPLSTTVASSVWNQSIGRILITGDVYSGRSNISAYANNGLIIINGDLKHDVANGNTAAIGSTISGLVILNGNIRHHYGTTGYYGLMLATGRVLYRNGSSKYTEYAEDNGNGVATGNPVVHAGYSAVNAGYPLESDVRYPVTYGAAGEKTGTCRVPAPQSVLYGVPVDDTIGLSTSLLVSASGSVVTDTSNTARKFKTNLSGTAIKYIGTFLHFTSGNLIGETREVIDFEEATQFITVNKSFSSIPTTGDTFILSGYSGR